MKQIQSFFCAIFLIIGFGGMPAVQGATGTSFFRQEAASLTSVELLNNFAYNFRNVSQGGPGELYKKNEYYVDEINCFRFGATLAPSNAELKIVWDFWKTSLWTACQKEPVLFALEQTGLEVLALINPLFDQIESQAGLIVKSIINVIRRQLNPYAPNTDTHIKAFTTLQILHKLLDLPYYIDDVNTKKEKKCFKKEVKQKFDKELIDNIVNALKTNALQPLAGQDKYRFFQHEYATILNMFSQLLGKYRNELSYNLREEFSDFEKNNLIVRHDHILYRNIDASAKPNFTGGHVELEVLCTTFREFGKKRDFTRYKPDYPILCVTNSAVRLANTVFNGESKGQEICFGESTSQFSQYLLEKILPAAFLAAIAKEKAITSPTPAEKDIKLANGYLVRLSKQVILDLPGPMNNLTLCMILEKPGAKETDLIEIKSLYPDPCRAKAYPTHVIPMGTACDDTTDALYVPWLSTSCTYELNDAPKRIELAQKQDLDRVAFKKRIEESHPCNDKTKNIFTTFHKDGKPVDAGINEDDEWALLLKAFADGRPVTT